MFPFSTILEAFTSAKNIRTPRLKAASAKLAVESLEARDVPTVLIKPAFGVEHASVGYSSPVMSSPPVNLIFWGSYWSTTAGQQNEATLIAKTKALVNTSYFSDLTEYGSDGKVTMGGYANVSSNPAQGFTTDDLANTVNTALTAYHSRYIRNHHSLTSPHAAHAPIYVVVTAPGASFEYGFDGYNFGASLSSASDLNNTRIVWVKTSLTYIHSAHAHQFYSVMKIDNFTTILSHELVESITNPIVVTAGASIPANLGGGNQIGDNEPDSRYEFRVNGILVQAYWSEIHKEYIVPDGSIITTTYAPVWNGNSFTGNYTFVFSTFHNILTQETSLFSLLQAANKPLSHPHLTSISLTALDNVFAHRGF